MNITEARIRANRRNAQLSTGPRTAEGKNRSKLNAYRHGLTAQVVVMPEEDLKRYQTFCQDFFTDWMPANTTETQLVQTLIDTQWRLNRSVSIENGIYALGHHDFEHVNNVDHPQIHTALTAATTYLNHSTKLENLSRQENRLRRTLQSSLKLYHQLQDRRRERERIELHQVVPIYKTHQMQNLP